MWKVHHEPFTIENWAHPIRTDNTTYTTFHEQKTFWHSAHYRQLWRKLVAVPLLWPPTQSSAPGILILSLLRMCSVFLRLPACRQILALQINSETPPRLIFRRHYLDSPNDRKTFTQWLRCYHFFSSRLLGGSDPNFRRCSNVFSVWSGKNNNSFNFAFRTYRHRFFSTAFEQFSFAQSSRFLGSNDWFLSIKVFFAAFTSFNSFDKCRLFLLWVVQLEWMNVIFYYDLIDKTNYKKSRICFRFDQNLALGLFQPEMLD